jgi:hypothetical protein
MAQDVRTKRFERVSAFARGDAQFQKLRAFGEVLARPGRKIVDDEDLVPALEERVGDVRPDEPCSAGDEDARCASVSARWSERIGYHERPGKTA